MAVAAAQTRLDRLVTLLDSGSTPTIRATAARQLGQLAATRVRGDSKPSAQDTHLVKSEKGEDDRSLIEGGDPSGQKSHPVHTIWSNTSDEALVYRGTEGDWDQAIFLIARVLPHLHSKTWDTRVAAGQAIESICNAAGIWDPDLSEQTQDRGNQMDAIAADLLDFDTFSLANVLASGKKLLSSAGSEYDLPSLHSVEERLAHAKRDMQRLGLGSMAGEEIDLGINVERELAGGDEATSTFPPTPTASSTASTKLQVPPTSGHTTHPQSEASPQPISEEVDLSKLSARERNQLKRKRRLEGKASNGSSAHTPSESSTTKTRVLETPATSTPVPGLKIKSPSLPASHDSASSNLTPKSESTSLTTRRVSEPDASLPNTPMSAESSAATLGMANDAASLVPSSGQWPFSLVNSLLLSDLFSPAWEIRHGAALGLRELFKSQGCSGGKTLNSLNERNVALNTEDGASSVDAPREILPTNAQRHERWAQDAAIRLLCVLSLDRLGDFVFDQVIAPVRETTGQALASLLRWMSKDSALKVHAILVQMVTQGFLVRECNESNALHLSARRGIPGYAWEVRHAGLLGMRYEVSIRKDLLLSHDGESPSDLLREVVHLCTICLRDDDDDVRSVAAATLLPIVDEIVKFVPEALEGLLDQLWACLIHLKDDLSSSTGGVMDLLASLVEKPTVVAHLSGIKKEDSSSASASISDYIPRLFPFFRHTITSVRLAVLNTLKSFLQVPSLSKDWSDDRLMRLLFQNLVVEEKQDVRKASFQTWTIALEVVISSERLVPVFKPHLSSLFSILLTPLGTPIDYSLFYRSSSGTASRETHNVDKGILAQDLSLVGVDTVIRGRLGAAGALGSIMAHWPRGADAPTFSAFFMDSLSSSSALQRCLACIVVQEWAEEIVQRIDATFDLIGTNELAKQIHAQLLVILEAPALSTYAEMVVMLHRIQRQSQLLYTTFQRDGKVKKDFVPTLPSNVDTHGHGQDAFTIDMAKDVIGSGFENLWKRVSSKLKSTVGKALEDRRKELIAQIGFYQSIKDKQDSQVAASAAAAVIALRVLPAKLNPVIRSIMNSVKFEENPDLQQRSASAVASLIDLCLQPNARANPTDKIIKNLCAFICQDTTQTPIFDKVKMHSEGIMFLIDGSASALAAQNGGKKSARSTDATSFDKSDAHLSQEQKEGRLIRRGAEFALREVCLRFGPRLLDVIPSLWQTMTVSLLDSFKGKVDETSQDVSEENGQAVLDCCTLIRLNVGNFDKSLHRHLTDLFPTLTQALQSQFSVVRAAAAGTLAAMAEQFTEKTMLHIVQNIIPLLGDMANVIHRQGAIDTISQVVRVLDVMLLPYVIVLIVPVLGRMSDADDSVRLVATNTFASLVQMVPLEVGLPDPPGFPEELMTKRQKERHFLTQLLDGSKVENYDIPVKVNAELRKYQQDGVNWMAFLAKFQLHGILCDDMGLGKTLQSICILAGKHFERAQQYEKTKSPDARKVPSLIVCPPTLTGHWCHEIKQYSTNLRPLLYAGHPNERARLQAQIPDYDCVVASYDTVRNDIASLSSFNWLYCILDEGHVIKSAKAKTTKAVKMIRAHHRLILSGTPIQNHVLELWSLFDFLMPGFLGTEKMFMERYGRPILASRDAKVTAREHERASLALEALHKQVLPFLLRRMKEDVLSDLPPKIIQDISCELGDIQRVMYDDYLRSQNPDDFEDALQNNNSAEKQHVFQTLQYLRKLVCHPALVFDERRPKHLEIQQNLAKNGRTLSDVNNAPKLLALKQLLQDCGIGVDTAAGTEGTFDDVTQASAISQHRVLIFCQQRQMLDLIEKDLLQRTMPSVTYARLDGSVSSAEKRFAIVQRFNSDPSIDVLLLTTSVGGLGLTLTGADTVIFVEHDWNPMKDMQAMDRAHRLGQKKVVTVYRLITKDTLEEKIMGLQRFKLNVAGNIVNQQNKGMDSMETDQILDLFGPAHADAGLSKDDVHKSKGVSQRALLQSLEGMSDTGDDYQDMQQWSVTS